MATICIYAINNLINNKTYIGSTMRFERRRSEHRWGLTTNRHGNCHLQSAWNRYGENGFEFVVLELVDNADLLIKREQHWLDLHQANGGVYNFGNCAEVPARGYHHTDEARRKISAGNKNKHVGDETRRRLSIANKGRRHTKRARRNMSVSHRGRCHTDEQRRKISATLARPYPAFVDPNGTIHPAGINLRAFCREHALHSGDMCYVASGKHKQHKGWRLAELPK